MSVVIRRAACSALVLCVACDSSAPAPVLELPARSVDAAGGAEIASEIRTLDLEAREERIYAEIAAGNVPTWLRQLGRVDLRGEIEGREHRVSFWVTPDYLAVGGDDDHFLIPLSAVTAQRLADLVGSSLPTARMVDAIWASARARLAPIRFPPDEFMTTVEYFERHDRLVQAQRWLRGVSPGTVVAGHKLDVVLTPRLSARPGRAAVYGWHRRDGEPIQPLYTALRDSWVGYSLGTRLVHREILVDGVQRDLLDVLRDPDLAPLLSDDGVFAEARYRTSRAPGTEE